MDHTDSDQLSQITRFTFWILTLTYFCLCCEVELQSNIWAISEHANHVTRLRWMLDSCCDRHFFPWSQHVYYWQAERHRRHISWSLTDFRIFIQRSTSANSQHFLSGVWRQYTSTFLVLSLFSVAPLVNHPIINRKIFIHISVTTAPLKRSMQSVP